MLIMLIICFHIIISIISITNIGDGCPVGRPSSRNVRSWHCCRGGYFFLYLSLFLEYLSSHWLGYLFHSCDYDWLGSQMCPTVQFNADLYSVCSLVLLKLYLIKGPNYNVKIVLHHMEAWLVGVNGQEMGKSSFEWTRNNSISIEIWIWMRQKSWYCVVWNTPHPPTHPRPLFPRSDVTISSQALDQGDGTELLRLRRFSQNSQERTPSLQILVNFTKTKTKARTLFNFSTKMWIFSN